MKQLFFLTTITFLVSTQLKSQKKDSIANFKKNEIGMNITSPLVLVLTGGNSSIANLIELNYKHGFKPNLYGRVNAGCRLSYDKGTRLVNIENYAYSVERIRYKDSYNYYKTQNLYNETVVFGSLGLEKRWRVGKLISPVLALDITAGKVSGQVNTYEQTVSDSTFTSSTPTKPIYNYNTKYDIGNKIYVQKIQAWSVGVDVSYGILVNLSKRFCLSGQLIGNFSLVNAQLKEKDIVLNSEITSGTRSTFDFRLRGNMNLYYKF